MNKTIIALDDEPLALILVEKYLQQLEGWELKATFTNSYAALDFVKNNAIDLILSDINMPDMTGLEFVSALPKDKKSLVIFVTAHKEHALESYELEVMDYLVKPVSFQRFEKALSKAAKWILLMQNAKNNNVSNEKDYLMVYSEYQLIRIIISEILYIQSMGDYVKIHLDTTSKPILTLERLKNIASNLEKKGFVRIHRSFVINTAKIEAFQKSKVKVGENWLSVGQTYLKKIELIF